MSGYREPLEPTRSGDTEGEWVDFPTSSDPEPMGSPLEESKPPSPDLIETQQGGNTSLPGRTPMVKRQPSNHLPIADHGLLKARHRFSFADYWDANGAVMTSLAVALRGLLVTAIAAAIVAFLLLTNSHI
jgi:hypothetical protein